MVAFASEGFSSGLLPSTTSRARPKKPGKDNAAISKDVICVFGVLIARESVRFMSTLHPEWKCIYRTTTILWLSGNNQHLVVLFFLPT